jgi:hypothetical protein
MPQMQSMTEIEKIGMVFLLDCGWNLSEVEAEFEPDWLSIGG